MRYRWGRSLAAGFGIAMILAATGSAGAAPVTIYSTFVTKSPTIDGAAAAAEWSGPVSYSFPHGVVLFRNDASTLYVLVDVTADTTQDTPPADYFWIDVDVNHNGVADPNVDVEYGLCNSSTDATRAFFLGSCSFTGCRSTSASIGYGFGSSPASSTPHTFWEYAIPLSELGASPGSRLGVDVRAASDNPPMTDDVPTTECDVAGYATLELSAIFGDGFESGTTSQWSAAM